MNIFSISSMFSILCTYGIISNYFNDFSSLNVMLTILFYISLTQFLICISDLFNKSLNVDIEKVKNIDNHVNLMHKSYNELLKKYKNIRSDYLKLKLNLYYISLAYYAKLQDKKSFDMICKSAIYFGVSEKILNSFEDFTNLIKDVDDGKIILNINDSTGKLIFEEKNNK